MPRGVPNPKRPAREDFEQSKPKRQVRGGIHRLKEEQATGTHWDNESYKTLKQAVVARGLWIKDMPKARMIRVLADYDTDQTRKKRAAEEQQQRKREREIAARKEREAREKQEREEAAARRAARERGEEEEIEYNIVGIEKYGEILDDEDFSTSSDDEPTPTASTASSMFKTTKLRILEWPFFDLPSPNSPKSPYSPGGRRRSSVASEVQPRKIPYVVMNLVTTWTNETVELPGRNYPRAIRGDFVPRLPENVTKAARNGVMIGTLRRAIIETGSEWALRTQVQGWNGRMYFNLPERIDMGPITPTTPVVEITDKTPAKGKKRRKSMTAKEKAVIENYAAVDDRPPICFAPAYLDYVDPDRREDLSRHNLDNLYYIRFPGCDLPHYYFWTWAGDWRVPTLPNRSWDGVKAQDQEDELREKQFREQTFEEDRKKLHIKPRDLETTWRPYPQDTSKTRVQKSNPSLGNQPRSASKFKQALSELENDLFHRGLQATLFRLQRDWKAEGKERHWRHITEKLMDAFPSGILPRVPPVHREVPNTPKPTCLAVKLASIEVPSQERPVSPILGDEPWTRDDDACWDIVDKARLERAFSLENPLPPEPLLHPATLVSSAGLQGGLPRNFEEFDTWLKDVSPSYSPSTVPKSRAPSTVAASPVAKTFREFERQRWEDVFRKHAEEDSRSHDIIRTSRTPKSAAIPELMSQIEDMPVAELKHQLYTLMSNQLKQDSYCRVCLEPLEKGDQQCVNKHYEQHQDDADRICPFCGMEWWFLDSQWKASHVFGHDFDPRSVGLYRRPSSIIVGSRRPSQPSEEPPSGGRRKSSASSRTSKVHFAPTTVEKRVGYNDEKEERAEAEGLSPKKSSLKKSDSPKGKKKGLKIDTTVSGRVEKSRSENEKRRGRPRHGSEHQYKPPSTPSDHVTSPYLPWVHRYPADHPKAAWKPRRDSSPQDDLEFLEETSRGKKRKRGGASRRVEEDTPGKKAKHSNSQDAEYVERGSLRGSSTHPDNVKIPKPPRRPEDPTDRPDPHSASTDSQIILPVVKPARGQRTLGAELIDRHIRSAALSPNMVPIQPNRFKKTGLFSGVDQPPGSSTISIVSSTTSDNDKQPTAVKRTIFGNPYVEPKIVAPAVPLGRVTRSQTTAESQQTASSSTRKKKSKPEGFGFSYSSYSGSSASLSPTATRTSAPPSYAAE